MDTHCPICMCEMPSELICIPLTGGEVLHNLASKINPEWHLSDGMCMTCMNALSDAIKDANNVPKPSEFPYYLQYYRYYMCRREHGQWNHCNPDMKQWRQGQIIELASDNAIALGYKGWLIIDIDEVMVGQGTTHLY